MTTNFLQALEERGALLEGHFRLSSGRHSAKFIQKFRVLEDPKLVGSVAGALIAALPDDARPTVVVSAAVGGIVLGYEVARQLGLRAIFAEKESGVPTLRRGFKLGMDDRALVVEDVVTTGLSVHEVIEVVRTWGARVAAVAVIVRRAPADFGVPTVALLDIPIESFAADECPQCLAGQPITEPGSRFLR